jgi:hypothetical protein
MLLIRIPALSGRNIFFWRGSKTPLPHLPRPRRRRRPQPTSSCREPLRTLRQPAPAPAPHQPALRLHVLPQIVHPHAHPQHSSPTNRQLSDPCPLPATSSHRSPGRFPIPPATTLTHLPNMSVLPAEVHTALANLLQGLQSPDNVQRTNAEQQLNEEWVAQRPDVLLMGLSEQIELAQDTSVCARHAPRLAWQAYVHYRPGHSPPSSLGVSPRNPESRLRAKRQTSS